MIAGHAPLAFALVAVMATVSGASSERALRLGLVAGGFALVPDVDMVYAVAGLLGANPAGLWGAVDAFWTSSKVVHRDLSHSLLVAIPAVIGFAAVTTQRFKGVASLPLIGLITLGGVTGGLLGGVIMGLYVAMGLAVVLIASALDLGPQAILATAVVGLGLHPFGDIFTGTPPSFFAPLGVEVLVERVALHPDPTLNLLAIFGVELLCLWAAVVVATELTGRSIQATIDWRATAGAAYGAAAVVMPAPTLDVSYHFVFSVVAIGSVGVAPLGFELTRDRLVSATITGLAAISLAGTAYTVVYLIV